MKKTPPTAAPALELNTLTKGHYKLLQRMGLAIASEPQPGETDAQWAERLASSLTAAQRSDEGSAFLWLVTRPVAELEPGGKARQAIDDGTWRDLVEAFEFSLDADTIEAFDAALAAKAGRRSRKP